MNAPHRYRSDDEDSARWAGFAFRPGDIVISTRSKHGTTWLQVICLLLIHGTPDLPGRVATLSPWLDHLVEPRTDVVTRLTAQPGRRVIKTHTPLDGVPLDPRAHYVVGARHPLDAAVSLYHQGDNLDRDRLAQLTGTSPRDRPPRPPVEEWLRRWIAEDADPRELLDSLPGVVWHLRDACARRSAPNVTLVHYADLEADLDGEMRRLAARLSAPVDEDRWPQLVAAASWDRMRARPADVVPDTRGVLKDPAAFFRRGRSGAGREVLDDAAYAAYQARLAVLTPADLLGWLDRP